MKPLFKHDCDECKFVKVGKDYFGETADVYVCKNVVLFRLSDEPSDNRTVSMITAMTFKESYQDILNDQDIMKAYYEVN